MAVALIGAVAAAVTAAAGAVKLGVDIKKSADQAGEDAKKTETAQTMALVQEGAKTASTIVGAFGDVHQALGYGDKQT